MDAIDSKKISLYLLTCFWEYLKRDFSWNLESFIARLIASNGFYQQYLKSIKSGVKWGVVDFVKY